jgi:nucleoside-diphosphate-sugar epimerase
LIDAGDRPADVEFVQGDIRDRDVVRSACDGVDVILHNVAQVPLAKDTALFESVNVYGTHVLLDCAHEARVSKVVCTSSSAVFGVPSHNPVTLATKPNPAEDYGLAKYRGELLCRAAASRGLDVTIVRPRTIVGHGRLGIFAILFDWIADGVDVFVFGNGANRYQFVHAADLGDAIIRASKREGPALYNIGASEFGTMRESLESLCAHADTGSGVRGLPMKPAVAGMRALSRVGLAPFASYHWIMYGQSMWFDTTQATDELGWSARYSNAAMFAESYDWFLANRHNLTAGESSHHRSPLKQGVLSSAKALLRWT